MKRNQVGLSILDFIERGLFSRATLDVSKTVVVIDGRDEEWLPSRLCVELVIELEFRRVNGTEMVDLLRGLGLRSVDLFRRLSPERLQFLLVCLGLTTADVPVQPVIHLDFLTFLRLA